MLVPDRTRYYGPTTNHLRRRRSLGRRGIFRDGVVITTALGQSALDSNTLAYVYVSVLVCK